jgi:glyoxylase-like metal-dependent hydrolase (beta-lactamase superfamily II)
MFGNAPRALWERWIEPDAAHRIPLACRALLVDGLAGRRVLFEAGVGSPFAPDLRARYGIEEPRHVLAEALEALGMPHDSVDLVVLSHLHFDHAGGVLRAWREGEPPALLSPRRASSSAAAPGSAPAPRILATGPRSCPSCRACSKPAAASISSTGRTCRRSVPPFASTTATATRRG